MKCESCGKRLKKSDEICPECGRFIRRTVTVTETEAKPEIFASADPVCSENEIIYKDNIPAFAFKLVIAAVFIVICIISFIDSFPYNSFSAQNIILIIGAIPVCADAFAVLFQERGCKLTFEEELFFGTVPDGKFSKSEISIRYDEICTTDMITGNKYTPTHLMIILHSGDKQKILCSDKKTLTKIEERLQKHLTELKISSLDTTVVYHGETVDGSLINGKEYTLVNIDEDGMYEIIDESGESGFFYPEFFKKR